MPSSHREQYLEAAISKAVELRALRAAVLHHPAASPSFARFPAPIAGDEYPVFAPSYEEERSATHTGPELRITGGGEAEENGTTTGSPSDQRSGNSFRWKHVHSSSSELRSIVTRSRNSLSNRNAAAGTTFLTLPEAQQRSRSLSWLVQRFRRKPKSPEGEMKAVVEELRGKLQDLEVYCEELKKALKQAVRTKAPATMPVPEKAMVEGFLQMVAESRLAVKQFCKSLASKLDELGPAVVERSRGNRRMVVYQLEAVVNRWLHQDFENCVFRRDGAQRELEPGRERSGNFASFVELRNLSWSEVVGKGTRWYSEEFSGFCDRKMGAVAAALGWVGRWPEEQLQGFFVAAKCVWLLHLLAFAFDPPVGIVRVDEGREFDALYMDHITTAAAGERARPPARVKSMVAPGFFVVDRVIKCRVICRYRNA